MEKQLIGIFLSVLMVTSAFSQVLCNADSAEEQQKSDVINMNFMIPEEPAGQGTNKGDIAAKSEPAIMDFSTLATFYETVAMFNSKDDTNVAGRYTFVTLDDGTKCMRLNYDRYDESLEDYRIMAAFKEKNKVTADHKYMRVTYMTSETTFEKLTLYNNGKRTEAILDANTSKNAGKWVCTEPVDISAGGMLERYMKGMHCTLQFTSDLENAGIYIKEVGIFTSIQQAYEYYGDSDNGGEQYAVMTFGDNGSGMIYTGENYGESFINTNTDTVDITYAEKTNFAHDIKYMSKLRFKAKGSVPAENRFIRVLYSAKNPANTVGASLFILNDGASTKEIIELQKNLTDTNGSYVLSDTVCLTEKMMTRFSGTMHCSFCTTAANPDGEYSIKAIYFFPTRKAAESFDVQNTFKSVTVNGNDISKYRIVVSESLSDVAMNAVKSFAAHIYSLSGVNIEIVYDDTPESEYEILIGTSKRAQSTKPLEGYDLAADDHRRFGVGFDNNDLIIAAADAYSIKEAIDSFISGHLYGGTNNVPDKIDINESMAFSDISGLLKHSSKVYVPTNVETPLIFTEDFDSDEGYFSEENNTSDWRYENGEYKTSANTDEPSLSYVHVYESNVDYTASVKYSNVDKNGELGLMVRYNAADAYVKSGYDFADGVWYIEYREGNDFYKVRAASKKADIIPEKQYIMNVTANGDSITLKVDGGEIITARVPHLTPGRIAVYAKGADVSVDNVACVLMSGEGTVMKNIVHTVLTPDTTGEGGSAYEMSDGSLIFQTPQNGRPAYRSVDDGKTWVKTETVFDTNKKYSQVIRLANGDFLQVIQGEFNGEDCLYSQISSDDGKTWISGGKICTSVYKNTKAAAGNMNDKLFVSATTGRIFYCQNFSSDTPVNGRYVFCEFYYSDDNGKTWVKSETDSWEIEGNEKEKYFGECKILECADGTLRMYNSWNDYGCIVFSESTDNGVTWGPIVKIPELVCARSSMQFCRDPYADNDTTYYMVWVYSEPDGYGSIMRRSRLSLAKTTDGKNWSYLGDIWRWETPYEDVGRGQRINQVVDPMVFASENAIIIGSGISEKLPPDGNIGTHSYQQQNVWAIQRDSIPAGKPMNSFTDVKPGAAYYDAITFVTDQKLFTGTSDVTFEPDTVMNRAMFVTVLGRLDDVDASVYTDVTFTDVVRGSWYASYVEWAAAKGIVNGIGNGLYGINEPVTVEQVLTILYRYSGGKSAAEANGLSLDGFTDSASVSAFAQDAVKWAVENSIYAGQNGKLNPTAHASRALVAEIICNFASTISK